MRVAFYDKGNLKEKENYGKGIIYDEKGEPILENGEELLWHGKNIFATISEDWGSFWISWAKDIFGGAGYGNLYRTNKRIIYIKEISPIRAWQAGVTGGWVWARELKNRGYRECFDIYLEEIVGVYEKERWVDKISIYFLHNNKLYWLFLDEILDKNVFLDLLEKKRRLSSKEVDELKEKYKNEVKK